MAQVGRISGPLLEANLVRNGTDLSFRNDLDTTQLLYLDVNTGRIAVNNDVAAVELDVIDTTIQTVNLISNETNFTSIANYTIGNNNINVATGNIFLNADEAIVLSNLETEQFYATDSAISTKESDTNIELRPNGTGTLEVYNNLNIFGNLSTPGNITLEGTITFGNNLSQDTVNFNADVNSDIIPDISETFNLGRLTSRWRDISVNLVNGVEVSASSAVLAGLDLNLRANNTFYVSKNGNNSNVGNHVQGPLATIQEALSRADTSTNSPVIVYIFPGEYQEELPLVVPANVSIVGHDMRNVIIMPDPTSQTQDVFHLNGESTVQNITIKDFYYDDVNNTGHAFRFAPNAITTTRSPYIQNVSVITQETSLGSFDAGRGAWINGNEMNPLSVEASMLFHSCTFITPNADAITMTNGVRVEWLNSFTYFANRGLYAVDGVNGRLSQDGSTVIYGAELRAIGSASVYGNYGAVADGPGTLMYLIQHNFGYIGSGLDSSNDRTLAIQENEVVKLNGGKIYYQTTDHIGAFRVGDNFLVDLETGKSTIDISSLSTESLSGLIISSNGNDTVIDGTKIESGNIRFTQNRLDSLVGDLNIDSATGVLNFNDNTSVNGNIIIRDNFSFGGTLNIKGNEAADRITFNVEFDQDFNPNQHQTFNLGSLEKQWLSAYLSKAEISDIFIYDNVINTKVSNADLELRANGTGTIIVPSNNAEISNNLTISGITYLQPLSITGSLLHTNDRTQIGDYVQGGELTVDDLYFEDNVITTNVSNANFELRAVSNNIISVPSNNVEIESNLTVSGISTLNGLINITGTITHVGITEQAGSYFLSGNQDVNQRLIVGAATQFEEIIIDDNYITTTTSNADLELRANSNGKILVPSNDLLINDNLQVLGTGINSVTIEAADTIEFDTANISSNFVITENNINSADSIELLANASGQVVFSDLEIANNITISNTTIIKDSIIEQGYGPEQVTNGTFDTDVAGWVQVGGGTVVRNPLGYVTLSAPAGVAQLISQSITVKPNTPYKFEIDFIDYSLIGPTSEISLRVFQSGVGDLASWFTNDLSAFEIPTTIAVNITTGAPTALTIALRVVGASTSWDNISLIEDLGLIETITPLEIDIIGLITQTGNTTQTGNITQTGNATINGNLDISSTLDFDNFVIDDNVIRNKRDGLSLLRTDPLNPLGFYEIIKAMIAGATVDDYPNQTEKNLINFLANGTTVDTGYANSYIDVNQSNSTTSSDALAWLQYIANGTSGITQVDEFIKSVIDELIDIEFNNIGTFNKEVLLFGDYFNPNIEMIANGTGSVIFPTNDVAISNNLFVSSINANDIVITQDVGLNEIVTTNGILEIDDNFISTTISNADLELRAVRNIKITNNLLVNNNIDVQESTTLKSLTVNGDITHLGLRTVSGNLVINGDMSVKKLFSNSEIQFNDIIFNDNVITTTSSNSNLDLLAAGTGTVNILQNNVSLNQNLSAESLISNTISVNNLVQTKEATFSDNITLFDNVITTTETNSSLELRTNFNNNVILELFKINENVLSTQTETITLKSSNLTVNSTGSIRLPIGSTASRIISNGNIRFNTSDNLFEGFSNGKVVTFSGIYSDNRRTTVLANPTSNILNFTINNNLVGLVNASGLAIHGIQTDDILLNANIISTTVSNSNLELKPNGLGETVIDSISIVSNTIKNNNNGALILSNENLGIIKFNVETAVAIPFGTIAERPINPEIGTARWNTDNEILEVWDGSVFTTAAGVGDTITVDEFQDLMLEYTLIFG
jgi:hypothetical protein